MKTEINDWIARGMDFPGGLALYEKYGSSPSQKRILRQTGDTRKNREIVEYELRKLLKNHIPRARSVAKIRRPVTATGTGGNNIPRVVPVAVPGGNKFPPVVPSAGPQGNKMPTAAPVAGPIASVKDPPGSAGTEHGVPRRENNPEARALREQVVTLLKHRDRFHAMLSMDDISVRKESALKILEFSHQISAIYDRLDHYNRHGFLPPAKEKRSRRPVGEMSLRQLILSQRNLRSNVSRNKNLMERSDDPAKKLKYARLLEHYRKMLDATDQKLRDEPL